MEEKLLWEEQLLMGSCKECDMIFGLGQHTDDVQRIKNIIYYAACDCREAHLPVRGTGCSYTDLTGSLGYNTLLAKGADLTYLYTYSTDVHQRIRVLVTMKDAFARWCDGSDPGSILNVCALLSPLNSYSDQKRLEWSVQDPISGGSSPSSISALL